MAVIDSKKLLPPKSTGSALAKQKFLVPVSNIIPKSSAIVKGTDLKSSNVPQNQPGDVESTAIVVQKKIVSIEKILGSSTIILKKSQEEKRKESEKEEFSKREQKLEERKIRPIPGIKIPSLPRTGFLDTIKRFLFYTMLGYAFNKFGKYIPKIIDLTTKLTPVYKFFEDFTGNVLNGVIDFVDKGYKAYDKVRTITKSIGGENAEKKFDEFSKQFNTFANLAIVAAMATMGGSDLSRKGKPGTIITGVDRVRGGRVSQPTQARYLQRYGKNAFAGRFGKSSLNALTRPGVGRLAGRVFGRVPIIGGLVDFIVSTVIFKENPGRAAAKSIGATLGAALGTFIPVPFVGTILGGILGDLLGGALYDTLVSSTSLKGKAQGGEVTRGGQKVNRPTTRRIQRIKTRPSKIRPQKTIPGKDIGGKKEIEKLFPSPKDPKYKNPLGILESTSNKLKNVPMIGGLMGASLDLVMGQKPDPTVFRKIGNGFGALIQNAINAETSTTLNNVQKEIVALANGGVVPRTFSPDENIGMKIGERIAKTLETMVNVRVNETLQAIRKEFGKEEGLGLVTDETTFPDGAAGGYYGGYSPQGFQKEIYDYLINVKKLSDIQALGIMANISRESGFRVDARQPGGPGIGLFQYSSDGRKSAFLRAVPDWETNWKGQIDYALREPGEPGPQYIATRFTSAQEAADWWMRKWERPAQIIQNSIGPLKHRNYLASVPKGPEGAAKFRAPASIGLGTGSGNLQEAKKLAAEMGLQLTSARRGPRYPGDRSLHITGRAMDFSNGVNTPQQLAFAKEMIKRYGSSLKQLIYTPLGFGISNGKKVPLSYWGEGTNRTHYDHVHVAFEDGGKVGGITRAVLGEKGPEFVLDTDTTAALEQNLPGFLDSINRADYKGTLQILSNYASYHNPAKSTLMLQRVIIEKPIPMQNRSSGFVPLDNNTSSNPTASLSIG